MEKKHILIVDDITTNLKCASDVLQDYFKLSLAKSGQQALDFLDKVKPDLILLDVHMPVMDGYETMERIKANPEIASIPVVFLTVDDQRDSEIKGLKLGAMDFILKPFEPAVMLSRINKILQIEDLRNNLTVSSKKDALTGIWNRKYLEDDIDHFLEKKDGKAFFIIMDIDNFKSINDTCGHIIGDMVIEKFAEIISSSIGPKDVAARLGGDEFVVFLKGNYSENELKEYCQMILERTESELAQVVENTVHPTVSIGVAEYPQDGYDYESLYAKADKALYFVKENGKNSFHFFKEREQTVIEEMDAYDMDKDMDRLERMIIERTNIKGAYKLEYEGFKHIFQFVSRTIGRTGQNVTIGMFSLAFDGADLSTDKLEDAMKKLESSIIVSLRQGDVTTRYSNFQYVVLLVDSTKENAEDISERVKATFNSINELGNIELNMTLRTVVAK